eukprot:COSAG06_NODE_120_length_23106_cov_18.311862_16_plen_174_part_00
MRWVCRLRENGTFFEFPLCLSRACLGKRMHFIYKWLKKCRFLTWHRPARAPRRGCFGRTLLLESRASSDPDRDRDTQRRTHTGREGERKGGGGGGERQRERERQRDHGFAVKSPISCVFVRSQSWQTTVFLSFEGLYARSGAYKRLRFVLVFGFVLFCTCSTASSSGWFMSPA